MLRRLTIAIAFCLHTTASSPKSVISWLGKSNHDTAFRTNNTAVSDCRLKGNALDIYGIPHSTTRQSTFLFSCLYVIVSFRGMGRCDCAIIPSTSSFISFRMCMWDWLPNSHCSNYCLLPYHFHSSHFRSLVCSSIADAIAITILKLLVHFYVWF